MRNRKDPENNSDNGSYRYVKVQFKTRDPHSYLAGVPQATQSNAEVVIP